MISKTIGFRGLAYFQTHPHISWEDTLTPPQKKNAEDTAEFIYPSDQSQTIRHVKPNW